MGMTRNFTWKGRMKIVGTVAALKHPPFYKREFFFLCRLSDTLVENLSLVIVQILCDSQLCSRAWLRAWHIVEHKCVFGE